jgi:hypothetical protein
LAENYKFVTVFIGHVTRDGKVSPEFLQFYKTSQTMIDLSDTKFAYVSFDHADSDWAHEFLNGEKEGIVVIRRGHLADRIVLPLTAGE